WRDLGLRGRTARIMPLLSGSASPRAGSSGGSEPEPRAPRIMHRWGIVLTVSLAVLIAGTVWFVGGDAGDALTHHDASQVPPAVIADARPDPGVPEAVGVFLQNGQAWRAARVMRDYLRDNPDAPPSAILLAARAEAGWGGWDRVRRYLDGRPWLDDAEGGEGWYWLARALEHDEEWEPAAQAYE